MKRKALCIFLGVEAIICMLLYIFREKLTGTFSAVMAFPFEQLGRWLRALSLSSGFGNIIAIVLYVVLCISPVVMLYFVRKKRKLLTEDTLLGVFSALLFVVLYLMINPGLLGAHLGSLAGQNIGKALLGGMAYSVLCGYAVLRILRIFFAADNQKLQKYLATLLYVLNILFVYFAFGSCFGELLDAFDKLRAGNTGNEHLLGMSYIFLVLQYFVDALPYMLDVLVVFVAIRLLRELNADRYSEASVSAAKMLSKWCRLALIITVLSNMAFNLLQLIFSRTLMVVNGSVQIPLLSIAFVLATLLLARFIEENKQLKDDNDMFI